MPKSQFSRDKWSTAKRAKRAAIRFAKTGKHTNNPFDWFEQGAMHSHWADHYIREVLRLHVACANAEWAALHNAAEKVTMRPYSP